MLLSVWFLPKFIGIYALLVGYVLVYGVDVVLNLRLIAKRTGVKLKIGGFAFYALIFSLPSALLGFLLKSLLLKTLGMFLTTIISSIIITAFNCAFYIIFGLIDYKILLEKLPLSKFRRKKRNARTLARFTTRHYSTKVIEFPYLS